MIEGVSLASIGGEYYWNDELYYRDVLPKIRHNLSKDELFLISKRDNIEHLTHEQKLYGSLIKNISIDYDDDNICHISMSIQSYLLQFKVIFHNVSNFRLYQDNQTHLFNEIFSVYLTQEYTKERWKILSQKRFYFTCPLFPVKSRKFHFIEYDTLEIQNLFIKNYEVNHHMHD